MRVYFNETWHDYPDGSVHGRTVVYRAGRSYKLDDKVAKRALASGRGKEVKPSRRARAYTPSVFSDTLAPAEVGEGLDRNHDAAVE